MKSTLVLVALVSSVNVLAGVPRNPVRPRPNPFPVGRSVLNRLACQGMQDGDYVTFNATSEVNVAPFQFRLSKPLGGMLPAFEPVESVGYQLSSAQMQANGDLEAGFVADLAFAGGGTQTATLEYSPSKNTQDVANNSKLTIHLSTFDETRGVRVENDTVYLFNCATPQD